MNTNIESLYDYVLQQMAGESYFEGISPTDVELIRDRLRLGTNREGYPPGAGTGNASLNEGYPGNTRMTKAQADEFLEQVSARTPVVGQPDSNRFPPGRGGPNRPAATQRRDTRSWPIPACRPRSSRTSAPAPTPCPSAPPNSARGPMVAMASATRSGPIFRKLA